METNDSSIRTTPLLALMAGAALTLAFLAASRPRVTGAVATWSADDLAVVWLWCSAVAAGAWLAVTTLACLVTVGRGDANRARRIAAWAPPLVRRALQASLAGALVVAPAVAIAGVPTGAFATTPQAPIVVYVDGQGRLTTGAPGGTPATDVPVVRTPAPSSTTTTPAAGPTVPAAHAAPAPNFPSAPPAPAGPDASRPAPPRAPRRPSPIRAAAPTIAGGRVYIVRAGDNLWRIARAEVARVTGVGGPSDADIAPYWQRVIAANRASLRSGNPSLIFPGEAVTLPARSAPAAEIPPAE